MKLGTKYKGKHICVQGIFDQLLSISLSGETLPALAGGLARITQHNII
jgi:hypothetical protein